MLGVGVRLWFAAVLLVLSTCFGAAPLSGAQTARTRNAAVIHILNGCGEERGVRPRFVGLECSGAGYGGPEGARLRYSHYGGQVAVATGFFGACFEVPRGQPLAPPSTWHECTLGSVLGVPQTGQEMISRRLKASFRFSDVVRCHAEPGRHPRIGRGWTHGVRLFYAKVSYTYAGRPRQSESLLEPHWVGQLARLCSPVAHTRSAP